jgi:hypothetical protein
MEDWQKEVYSYNLRANSISWNAGAEHGAQVERGRILQTIKEKWESKLGDAAHGSMHALAMTLAEITNVIDDLPTWPQEAQ